jgi:two-component system nitrate/nitrite response regulator NarL
MDTGKIACILVPMPASSPRILLVDDHALYLTGLRLMLAEAWPDADVRAVPTWAEAMDALDEQAVDLILLDIHLPDAHGLAMLPDLRARVPHTPVLVMSADVNGVLVRDAREAGACGYLHKSASPPEVVAAVRAGLDGRQAWDQLPYDLLQQAAVPPAESVGHARATVLAEPALSLSPLQQDILRRVGQGVAVKAIARALDRSEGEVRAELSWVTDTLDASSREQAYELAVQRGLLTP